MPPARATMKRRDCLQIRGAYRLVGEPLLPVSGARHPLHREQARWLAWAAATTLVGCLAAWLAWQAAAQHPARSGRRHEVVLRRQPVAPGLQGPLRITPRLSLTDGTDEREQAARRAAARAPAPPRPAPAPAERGEIVVAPPRDPRPPAPAPPGAEPGPDFVNAVEMHMPATLNPCLVLESYTRPIYPTDVDEAARRLPRVTVKVNIYVNDEGIVTDALIAENDGPPAFGAAALATINSLKFRRARDPLCPPVEMWLVIPFDFKSPYVRRIPGATPPALP